MFRFLVPWQFSPTVVVAIVAVALSYARGQRVVRDQWWRQLLFWLGLTIIYGALHTRLDYYADREFFVHRLQHLCLHHIGPFLVALAWPSAAIRLGGVVMLGQRWVQPVLESRLVRGVLYVVMHPVIGAVLFVGLIWLWLIPDVHFYAMLDIRIYRVMNWSMAIDGLLFWWLVFDPRPSPPARIKRGWRALLLAAIVPPQVLSASLVTFAPCNIYPLYELCGRAFSAVSAMDDQTIGGVILWVPSTMMSIVGAVIVLTVWFRAEEKNVSCAESSHYGRPIG